MSTVQQEAFQSISQDESQWSSYLSTLFFSPSVHWNVINSSCMDSTVWTPGYMMEDNGVHSWALAPVLIAFCAITHLIWSTTLQAGNHCYLYLTGEETQVQRGSITRPKSHRWQTVVLRFGHKQYGYRAWILNHWYPTVFPWQIWPSRVIGIKQGTWGQQLGLTLQCVLGA